MIKAKKKEAFLILRVEYPFKVKVMAKAASLGETVSEFVRKALVRKV